MVREHLVNKFLALGFSLIPVRDKRPLIKWAEFQGRRATKNEVLAWLARFPGCDLGIVTGSISGLLVLDVDFKGPLGRPVPTTWTVNTPHGRHHYFRWEDAFSGAATTRAAALGTGLDLRGEGGYVVAPGSSGYIPAVSFCQGRLPRVPAWLRGFLGAGRSVEPVSQYSLRGPPPIPRGIVSVLEGIKEGNRNDSFTSVAGSLHRRGFSASEIYGLLQPRSSKVGFPDAELQAVISSVGRYARPDTQEASDAEDVSSFLENERKVEWIVESLVPRNSIGFVAGLPESGKTWLAVDLAITCSQQGSPLKNSGGLKWLDRFAVSSSRVLFLDQERWKGETQRRFKAVLAGKGIQPRELGDALGIRCGSTTRLDLQPSYDALRRELDNRRPSLVVVDSFATFSTADENNRQSIQIVLERIKTLRNDYQCTFLFLDHENKLAYEDQRTGAGPSMGRMVGSIAKVAAAEFVLTVKRQDSEVSTVYHSKSTMATASAPFSFSVRDVTDGGIRIESV